MKSRQSGSAHIIIFVIIGVLLVVAVGFLFWKNSSDGDGYKDDAKVSSYEECVKAEGSIIQESYPEVCVVKGKSFTNPSQKVVTPEPVSTQIFTSKKYGVSFRYPSMYKVEETGISDETYSGINYYASEVKIVDTQGRQVVRMNISTQLGGACGDQAPKVQVTTVNTQPLDSQGLQDGLSYGYSIVKDTDGKFRIAYGLGGSIKDDEEAIACPGMGVNYKYVARTKVSAINGIIFAKWYSEEDAGYSSYDEALAYSKTEEYAAIKDMIQSLSIKG